MIKDYEYLHGVVFSRLCSVQGECITIEPYPISGYNSSYIVNNHTGLYIKYSGKRLTPWRFTFLKSQQDEIQSLYNEFGEVFIALVCNLDGVAVLNYAELKEILDHQHGDFEWISVSKTKRKMYSVSGSDGKLDFKVSLTSCPDKIITYLKQPEQKSKCAPSASAFLMAVASPSE